MSPSAEVGRNGWLLLPPAGCPRRVPLTLRPGAGRSGLPAPLETAADICLLTNVLCLLCFLGSSGSPRKPWLTWPPRPESKYSLARGVLPSQSFCLLVSETYQKGKFSLFSSCSTENKEKLKPFIPSPLLGTGPPAAQHKPFPVPVGDPAVRLRSRFSLISNTA